MRGAEKIRLLIMSLCFQILLSECTDVVRGSTNVSRAVAEMSQQDHRTSSLFSMSIPGG